MWSTQIIHGLFGVSFTQVKCHISIFALTTMKVNDQWMGKWFCVGWGSFIKSGFMTRTPLSTFNYKEVHKNYFERKKKVFFMEMKSVTANML